MKNEKKLTIFDFCESCYHILEEKQQTADIDKDTSHIRRRSNYCQLCGQRLDDDDALYENDIEILESALENKNLRVIGFTAPSVRVSLGEEFGMGAGENVQGKMVTALKQLGFDEVFDMNLAADFTIVEEANEFAERLLKNQNLPLFTSCCPGWVNYCLKFYPEYKNHLSTAKSPQQMFGALINNYYAEAHGLKSTDMFVVSIVPCLAKKSEITIKSLNTNIGFDVDVAISTRELATLLKKRKIDLKTLQNSPYDPFFGASSGAGAIFGNTGGVMEAVLRTAADRLDNCEREMVEYDMVRGLDGIKRATIKLKNRNLNVAVVCGIKNAPIIFEELKKQPHKYDFVEFMACEGGCVGGPGQPKAGEIGKEETLRRRASGLYEVEKKCLSRKAHLNPAVIEVYQKYLGNIGGAKAKKLLHRSYKNAK